MKYQNRYLGTKPEFTDFVKKAVSELVAGKLEVEGTVVDIPDDADLDYKVKYDRDELGGSFSIKASWGSGGKALIGAEASIDAV